MSHKSNNAKGLYLEGIRDGHLRAALDKYTGDRYTQHSAGVADGKEGFLEFFTPFLERNPVRDIQIVRSIEDGRYVFCHAYQSLNNGASQWVTADLFDTDEQDRIIEHWDVIQEYAKTSTSGRTMVDGSAQIEDREYTQDNKTLVRTFIEDVLIGGNIDRIATYISASHYSQHNPHLDDGIDALGSYLRKAKTEGTDPNYLKIHALIGEGNFVVAYSHMKMQEDDYAVFDIFRLKDRKIVEHWDVLEKIGPKETWNNSGKF